MCSFKTEGTTEWLSWLDAVLPPMVGGGLTEDTSVRSIRICVILFLLPRLSFPPVKTDLSLLLLLLWPSLLGVFPLEQWVWELIYHPDFVTLGSRMKIALKQRRESPASSDNFSGVICIKRRKRAAVT